MSVDRFCMNMVCWGLMFTRNLHIMSMSNHNKTPNWDILHSHTLNLGIMTETNDIMIKMKVKLRMSYSLQALHQSQLTIKPDVFSWLQ